MIRRATVTTSSVLADVRLPEGYRVVWERQIAPETLELVIQGPFPETIGDGDMVSALVIDTGQGFEWQWIDEAGCNAGDRLPIP